MISLHACTDLSSLHDLKTQYLQTLITPMDGMWDAGIVNAAPHWELRWDGARAGYCAVSEHATLLQFYVSPDYDAHTRMLFDHVIADRALTHAEVSTIDPTCLALCLDVHKKIKVHTYLYEPRTDTSPSPQTTDSLDFRHVNASELERTIEFQKSCLGDDKNKEAMDAWLRGYSENLIAKQSLFALCRHDEWLGLGECRPSASQEGVADLGMMVAPAHRGKGWATNILTRLRAQCAAQKLRAICSTTAENTAAQKAIARTGFISRHRIMTVTF